MRSPARPFVGDELLQPADLALARVESVPLEFQRVGVEPLGGPAQRGAQALAPLLDAPRPLALLGRDAAGGDVAQSARDRPRGRGPAGAAGDLSVRSGLARGMRRSPSARAT